MLTEQQADDYNIALHELEAIEIGQQLAQKKMNEYYNAIEKVSSMMADATPEMMQRVRAVLPKLVEGYNSAKLKLSGYDDRHQQALSKVNEYKALEAQPVTKQTTRRRVVKQDPTQSYFGGEGRVTKEDGTMISPDGKTVVTPSGQVMMGVGIEDTLETPTGPDTSGWVLQNDGSKTAPDMTSVLVDGTVYDLKKDNDGNYYYNQIGNSNVKIYPSYGHGGALKTANGATIYPSEAHGGQQETPVTNTTANQYSGWITGQNGTYTSPNGKWKVNSNGRYQYSPTANFTNTGNIYYSKNPDGTWTTTNRRVYIP